MVGLFRSGAEDRCAEDPASHGRRGGGRTAEYSPPIRHRTTHTAPDAAPPAGPAAVAVVVAADGRALSLAAAVPDPPSLPHAASPPAHATATSAATVRVCHN
ncbi:hypothetical protein ACU686_03625 [Yinghuangia aomiensis]